MVIFMQKWTGDDGDGNTGSISFGKWTAVCGAEQRFPNQKKAQETATNIGRIMSNQHSDKIKPATHVQLKLSVWTVQL